MAEQPSIRLNKSFTRTEHLFGSRGRPPYPKRSEIEARPTTKISNEVYQLLLDEFETDKSKKDASFEISEEKRKEKEAASNFKRPKNSNAKRLLLNKKKWYVPKPPFRNLKL